MVIRSYLIEFLKRPDLFSFGRELTNVKKLIWQVKTQNRVAFLMNSYNIFQAIPDQMGFCQNCVMYCTSKPSAR